MGPIQLHSSPTFFVVFAAAVLVLLVLIQVGVLRYAFMRLGISSRAALLLLLGSLIGSNVNIPLVELGGHLTGLPDNDPFLSQSVPLIVDWGRTVIAVNVGGAVVPIGMSLYLLVTNRLWAVGVLATAGVAAVCYWLARPVPGVGIELPILVPSFATAAVALMFGGRRAAALAYISGSLGTLIGADLLNLGQVQALRVHAAAIGGAGTFDGIFLIGILAVLIASFSGRRDNARDRGAVSKQTL